MTRTARTSSGSFPLFKLFGVQVYVHWSWFLVAVLLIQWQSQGGAGGIATQTAIYLTLFAIVLIHEFGHALACRSVGGRADHITLWPLGGVAFVQPPERPGALLWSIAAGPLVNVALVPVTMLAAWLIVPGMKGYQPVETWLASLSPIQMYVASVTMINFALLAFNLLPIYPLDGGQILQAVLWFFIGRVRSLRFTAGLGLVIAVVGGAYMLASGDWWLFLIAIFIGFQAWRGLQVARYLAYQEQAHPERAEPWKM